MTNKRSLFFPHDMIESTRNFLQSLAGEAPKHGTPQDDLSKMHEFSIDEYRPMRVIAVGAGMTGVVAGIRLAWKGYHSA